MKEKPNKCKKDKKINIICSFLINIGEDKKIYY